MKSTSVRGLFITGAMLLLSVAAPRVQAQTCSVTAANLHGWYGMLVSGGSTASPPAAKYLVGAVQFDGVGTFSGSNIFGAAAGPSAVTGSFVANADCTFTLTMTVGTAAASMYTVALEGTGEASGIEVDPTAVATITLKPQYAAYTAGLNFTSSSLNGTFAGNCIGPLGGYSDTNLATYLNGAISGTDPFNNAGILQVANNPYTGTYTVNTDGTVSGSGTVDGVSINVYGVISTSNTSFDYIYVNPALAAGPFESCSADLASTTAVTPPPSFSLAPTSATLSVAQGGSGSDAITVTPAGGFTGSVGFTVAGLPTGASATFSPASSTSGSTLSVTVGSSTPTGGSKLTITGTSGTVTASTSVALTVTGTGTGTGQVTDVNLAAADNLYGIANNGTGNGGLGGSGYSYSSNLLGTSLSWAGQTFELGSASAPSAASSTTITLPAGQFTTLSLLGTGIYGSQLNQVFTVTYTDGTTSTYQQSLSDWGAPQKFTGESIAATMAYRVLPSGATQAGPWYLYGYSFALNGAKTVKSLTLPKNANVEVLAVNVSGGTGLNGLTPVSLTPAYNTDAVVTNGTPVAKGGFDGSGNAYSSTLLGSSVTWNGITFAIGPANAADAVKNTTIMLPAGNYSTLNVLAAASFGPRTGTWVVTYSDGSTSSFAQSFSDWGVPKNYPDEAIASTMAYRVTVSGGSQNGPWYLYGYSYPLNTAKTVKSLTLPASANIVVLGVAVSK
jgi:hypothetical protein